MEWNQMWTETTAYTLETSKCWSKVGKRQMRPKQNPSLDLLTTISQDLTLYLFLVIMNELSIYPHFLIFSKFSVLNVIPYIPY